MDEGLIIYEHSDKQPIDWNTQDYFTFTVSFPPAALGPQVFHINISYEIRAHDQSSQLFANTGKFCAIIYYLIFAETQVRFYGIISKFYTVEKPHYLIDNFHILV